MWGFYAREIRFLFARLPLEVAWDPYGFPRADDLRSKRDGDVNG